MPDLTCPKTEETPKGDVSVGYGRGAQQGVEDRAKADAEKVADRDADAKAKSEYRCVPFEIHGTHISGRARNKKTTIEKPAWVDSNGVWHATAKCTWKLTVVCAHGGTSMAAAHVGEPGYAGTLKPPKPGKPVKPVKKPKPGKPGKPYTPGS